jgi:adhesin transport system membrane fusion protein
MPWFPRRAAPAGVTLPGPSTMSTVTRRGDQAFLSGVRAAQVVEATPHVAWALYLMIVAVAAALGWASLARVDEITKADGRVVPEGREQVIASLEGGILGALFVHEGQQVEVGQDLAQLDPTRFEAQQAESQVKRLALKASIARLTAEANGKALALPADVLGNVALVRSETESYTARKRALEDGLEANRRNLELMQKELAVDEQMSAKGLMSDIEVMHLRRQVNDLTIANQDRVNRFRQDATADLSRLQTEAAQLDEQLAGRQDVLRRTVVKSPVKGVVKNIRVATVGGIVGPGAPIMEIVPTSARVLIEARVKPGDIGFLHPGQKAEVKLNAYEFSIYGGLEGHIESISPDALGDPDRATTPTSDPTYYRVMVRVDEVTLKEKGKVLPILPGMTGAVELRVGERSVLNFLLRPMLKSKEAFRER